MSLFGAFERRGVESPLYPLNTPAILGALGQLASRNKFGKEAKTPKDAMRFSPVYRSVNLISSVSASLDLSAYEPNTRKKVSDDLLFDPHPELTPLEFWRLTFAHRCLWGNHFSQKVKNTAGQIVWLNPLNPGQVKVTTEKKSADNPSGKVYLVDLGEGKGWKAYDSNDIFHIPAPVSFNGLEGVAPIALARIAIEHGLAAEAYGANLFESGNLVSGILQTDKSLEKDQADALKERWKAKMLGASNAHDIAVIDSGAKWQSLTMPNDDAQFLESRSFQTGEIGRFFGIPPFLMHLMEKSTSWGTGLEQQAIGWVTFDLAPTWLAPTEQRVTKHLLNNKKVARYSVEDLLRGDSTARAAFYRVMREIGAYSANDVRAREDMEPIENGDTYLQPTNLAPLGSQPNPPQGGTNNE